MNKKLVKDLKYDSKHSNISLKNRLYETMFETDTPPNKVFDTFLAIIIILSVLVVILESVSSIHDKYGYILKMLEWIFMILFTLEYIVRILVVPKSRKYLTSFFGIVDFVAIVPSYILLLVGGSASILVVRILRLLRMFRVLKLTRYIEEANFLINALKSSFPKILVFLLANVVLVVIAGATLYLVEGPAPGFENIPQGMYWAVVTITTTGYGDVVPLTTLGKFIASLLMVLAYGVIAVPTGILSAEIMRRAFLEKTGGITCKCGNIISDKNAAYCHVCGKKLVIVASKN